jgi:hypothetical protein
MRLLAILFLVVLLGCRGADVVGPLDLVGRKSLAPVDSSQANEPPPPIREWYFNEDGSCVQHSIAIHAIRCNEIAASTLLWDTEYGSAVRGGSWPARVADYCNARGIKAFNVTGDVTWHWLDWAAKTGRGAAIGADYRHFQTLMGKSGKDWIVCDNRSPASVDRYDEDGFRRLHLASGQWVVILDCAAPPAAPKYVRWW